MLKQFTVNLLALSLAIGAAASAHAALTVTLNTDIPAGIAAFGPSNSLINWDNTSGGVDLGTGNSVTGNYNISNWIDGPGFGGALSKPELAINGVENFTLHFTAPVTRIALAVSTGTGLFPTEVRNTGSAFDLSSDASGNGAFTLADPGRGQTWWMVIEGDSAFSSLTFTENSTLGDGIWDQYFGNVVSSAVPEPATWAMMIAGFGMVGSSLRRRRLVRPSYA